MGTISMSLAERQKLAAFSRVEAGELSLKKAAELLKLSYRQAKRAIARWRAEGDQGLVHRLRGRPSNRVADDDRRERRAKILAAYRERYADYGPTLAAECLSEEGLPVLGETLRRWLIAEGWRKPDRRRPKHRRRRPRRPRTGELLQLDGSPHDWFEGRRPWATLMVAVDDATGRVLARFFEQETLAAAQETFQRYVESYGLPQAVYVDRASIYRPERPEPREEPREEAGGEFDGGGDPFDETPVLTQFGRAMRTLGVELILARSPEAKGRVERMNGTLQGRLPKGLRRAGIDSLAEANRFLEEQFLPSFNARFARPAADEGDAHRLAAGWDLQRILSVQEERTLQRDWTISWRRRKLQVPAAEARRLDRLKPGVKLWVCEQRDGRLRLFALGDVDEEIAWSDVREAMGSSASRTSSPRRRQGDVRSAQGLKPAATHPWKRPFKTPPPPNRGEGTPESR